MQVSTEMKPEGSNRFNNRACVKLRRRKTGAGVMALMFCCLALAASCKKGVVYQPDPRDTPPLTPLVSVMYDCGALGDLGYNDLIYRGVEDAARRYGLRTLQLSPSSWDEGMETLQALFAQASSAKDTVRRLLIVAGASYDDFVRSNCTSLENNPNANLLYLETSTPLESKGSTLYISYYGAMYEAGAIAPSVSPEVLLVAANPKTETVKKAKEGFSDGFRSGHISTAQENKLVTCYISDNPDGGFSVADSTALRLMYKREWQGNRHLLVPICGGSASTFYRMCDLLDGYEYMGIDVPVLSPDCPFSVVKHIDRAVGLCIGQWLSPEGMPKHQSFSLADGYAEVVMHEDIVSDEVWKAIHEEAMKKEAEYER